MAADNGVDPSTITTVEQLGKSWQRLLDLAGMSRRSLATKAAREPGGGPLPRSTTTEIINGRMPTRDQQTRFLAMVGVTDEDELDAWHEAWTRVNEHQRRFGSQDLASALPMGAFLESGPKEAALRQLRRQIPEAAAELEKLGPGSAVEILFKWPDDIRAEVLAAMDVHAATALLLASPTRGAVIRLLRKMPAERAKACVKAMGSASVASSAFPFWTGPWFLPKRLRGAEDPLLAEINDYRRFNLIAISVVGGAATALMWIFWGAIDWLAREDHA